MSRVSLEAQCRSAVQIVLDTVLEDEPWRHFGYPRRPRRGKMFDWLQSRAARELETTLLRELYGAGLGCIARWALERSDFRLREQFLGRLLEITIDGVRDMSALPIWPVFRFETRGELVEFGLNAVRDYAANTVDEHPRIFLGRSARSLAQPIPKPWCVGAVWLFAHPASLVRNAQFGLSSSQVAQNDNCDIVVSDQQILSRVSAVMRGSGNR